MAKRGIAVLGAGVSGLAAGMSSGAPVFEASDRFGGICGSYYRVVDGTHRYRFEVGGGHWIWGGDPAMCHVLSRITPFRTYVRKAAVFLPGSGRFIAYPIQDHLGDLSPEVATSALLAILEARGKRNQAVTLDQWLEAQFGPTLHRLFFGPFHELYTAGLSRTVAPQDAAKSPLDLEKAVKGLVSAPLETSGYNATFRYPAEGLDALVNGMAARCREMHLDSRVVQIEAQERLLHFENGQVFPYTDLISTLPLAVLERLANAGNCAPPDPYTSVLVVNIGACKGRDCPPYHWVYLPASQSGFHRVGFYSNVDQSFASHRDTVSVYVEIACPGGCQPGAGQTELQSRAVIAELQSLGWIGEVEVVDATWVECAYTWVNPGSHWAGALVERLSSQGIHPVGRYGRWASDVQGQGIMPSIKDGLACGAAMRSLQE